MAGLEKKKVAQMLWNNFKMNLAAGLTLFVAGALLGLGMGLAFFVAGGMLGTFLIYVCSMLDLNGM